MDALNQPPKSGRQPVYYQVTLTYGDLSAIRELLKAISSFAVPFNDPPPAISSLLRRLDRATRMK